MNEEEAKKAHDEWSKVAYGMLISGFSERAFLAGAKWMREQWAQNIERVIKSETGDASRARQYAEKIREGDW